MRLKRLISNVFVFYGVIPHFPVTNHRSKRGRQPTTDGSSDFTFNLKGNYIHCKYDFFCCYQYRYLNSEEPNCSGEGNSVAPHDIIKRFQSTFVQPEMDWWRSHCYWKSERMDNRSVWLPCKWLRTYGFRLLIVSKSETPRNQLSIVIFSHVKHSMFGKALAYLRSNRYIFGQFRQSCFGSLNHTLLPDVKWSAPSRMGLDQSGMLSGTDELT